MDGGNPDGCTVTLRAIDLFCGAGGASIGLSQAGFEVAGIDIKDQPRYPFEFVQADVLEFLKTADLSPFDLIWASPPCQKHTIMRHAPGTKAHRNWIAPTRALLKQSGKPYCIENVVGAREHLLSPVELCGSMFGLSAGGFHLERHRLFEVSGFRLTAPSPCKHVKPVVCVIGGHFRDRRRPTGTNHRPNSNIPDWIGHAAMGIDWMQTAEISEAIPPAYSRHVAEAFQRGCLTAREAM